MLKHAPAGAGQHIVHIRQPIVDPLNFRGLCLKECIPARRRTMRVLRIVSFGDHFPLASAKRSVPSSRKTPFSNLICSPRSAAASWAISEVMRRLLELLLKMRSPMTAVALSDLAT
jgi:hypothetical protein